MDAEEFTFPKISDNSHSYGIDSPPLWNLSPAASPNPYQELTEGNRGDEKDCNFEESLVPKGQRKKCFSSCVQNNGKKKIKGVDGEDNDSMDLLWESFNDESTLARDSSSSSSSSSCYVISSSSKELVEFKCLTALTKNNGALVQAKNRPGMVVIVKVLKKLFFLTNSQEKARRRLI